MGVIRHSTYKCESGRSTSSNIESPQSASTESDSETIPQSLERSQILKAISTAYSRNNRSGKRRLRRIENTKYLETLKEESEDDGLIDLTNKPNFHLLEENEDFISLDNDVDKYLKVKKVYYDRFLNIPRKIRIAIKNKFKIGKKFASKRNMQEENKDKSKNQEQILINQNESKDNLLETVEKKVKSIYAKPYGFADIYDPKNCFERFLLHAVSKYNGLHSETIIEENKKVVKITRPEINVEPVEPSLCDYLKQLKQK